MKRNLKRLVSSLVLCALLTAGLTLPASAARFTDVPTNYWAADSIRRCADLGLFQGKSATRFGVGEPMSRSAFAVVVCRFFGWENADPASLPFTDVPKDAWYAPALAAALAHGAITTQTDDFRPSEPLTREELAAALIRGLGYAPIAGLSQELDLPFTDVTTNRGYITMAYDMGLVNGTSKTTFSPEKIATREQCAVMLMRLYDKLHTAETGRVGVVTSEKNLPDLAGFDAVAVGGLKLIGGIQPRLVATVKDATPMRETVAAAQVKQLLCVTGNANGLKADQVQEVATMLHQAVTEGGYDGLFLDFPELRAWGDRDTFTRLIEAVKAQLGSKLLYVVADIPGQAGKSYEGYDYAALSRHADRLVLRVRTAAEETAVAPVEPLESVYYVLRHLWGNVDTKKVTLWMTTTATVLRGTQQEAPMTGLQVDALLADKHTDRYYSQRYGCSYLTTKQNLKSVTVWYPDADSTRERAELSRLFGVDQVCLGELSGMSPTMLQGLKK